MNLILILFLVAGFTVIALVAKILSSLFGVDPYTIGVPIGILAFILIGIHFWRLQHFALPKCHSGRCGPGDYTGIGFAKDLGIAERGVALRCRCGYEYLEAGNQVFSIGKDGRLKPYKMKRHFYGRWVDDPEGKLA